MSGRFTAILLLMSAVRYALADCDGECDVEEMAMLQSAKQSRPDRHSHQDDDCKCAEPNGNNNQIMCWNYIDMHDSMHWDWYGYGHCPLCCQCTSDAIFKKNEIAAQCHGGSQCGTCGT